MVDHHPGFASGRRGTVRVHGTPAGDRWWTARNRDYPGDTSLFWEAGTTTHEMRLTPADLDALRVQLNVAAPSAATVRAYLAALLVHAREDFEPACGEIGPGPDVRALERVIALLEEK